MSVFPESQSLPVPQPGAFHVSRTGSVICSHCEKKKNETEFPYMQRVWSCRECMFNCCGTDGMGMSHPEDRGSCKVLCKTKCIKYISNCFCGIVSCLWAITTCGYGAYKECQGYLADKRKLTQVVPGS